MWSAQPLKAGCNLLVDVTSFNNSDTVKVKRRAAYMLFTHHFILIPPCKVAQIYLVSFTTEWEFELGS